MPVNNPALPPTIAPKSIQRGLASISGAGLSTTATVTAVNTAKSELHIVGHDGQSTAAGEALIRGVLTNSTTITFNRGSSSTLSYASWELIEWN